MAVHLLFTGDIMAQIAQNKACQTAQGYDYSAVLRPLRPLLAQADVTIGNLETPFAGEERAYSFARYSFNTPEALARQIKQDGFSLVSLANNHCMDRDIDGLCHTLDTLDAIGLRHTGLARSAQERETPCILEAGGIRFGFLSYTYGTNAFAHHMFLPPDRPYAVNLLQPEETRPGAIDLLDRDRVPERVRALYEQPGALYDAEIAPRLAQLEADIARLRSGGADVVIPLLHCGGQYDPLPDAYTRWVVNRVARMGVDAIICHHQHILHPLDWVDGVPVAWCLGNLIHTPAEALLPGIGPSYSALLRLSWERAAGGARLACGGFRLTRSTTDEAGRTVVYPLAQLIARAQGADRAALLAARRHYVNLLQNNPPEADVEEADEYAFPAPAKA